MSPEALQAPLDSEPLETKHNARDSVSLDSWMSDLSEVQSRYLPTREDRGVGLRNDLEED